MRIKHARLTLGVLLAAAAVTIPFTVISFAFAGNATSLTRIAATATARYHSLGAAKAAGWSTVVKDKAGLTCIDNQPVGGMGVHYANGKLLGDAHLDANKPEALVYAPDAQGKLHFAALEYIVFADAWTKAGHGKAPELFGRQFTLTPAGNRFGLPAYWSLHVWVWTPNPAGLFKPWNPRVHC